eukprot:929356-Prymnesium_polylepis.1
MSEAAEDQLRSHLTLEQSAPPLDCSPEKASCAISCGSLAAAANGSPNDPATNVCSCENSIHFGECCHLPRNPQWPAMVSKLCWRVQRLNPPFECAPAEIFDLRTKRVACAQTRPEAQARRTHREHPSGIICLVQLPNVHDEHLPSFVAADL